MGLCNLRDLPGSVGYICNVRFGPKADIIWRERKTRGWLRTLPPIITLIGTKNQKSPSVTRVY